MADIRVLIVEDNMLVGVSVRDFLQGEGLAAEHVADAEGAAAALAGKSYSVVLLDLCLPEMDGRKLLHKWHQEFPGMHVIIMTAYGDIKKAVECIRAGAYDFLPKPVERVLLKKTVLNAAENLALTKQVRAFTEMQQRTSGVRLTGLVAQSPCMTALIDLAQRVAENDFSSLFIRGESGTGKGLLARLIHQHGRRSSKAFIEVNCSALPANLVESELFGHKRGAFTDAREDKVGLFELADGGTLFLDEIGDMAKGLQAKLLKAIEEKTFRRVGDVRELKSDVAIIAATNQHVEELVAKGDFREDLYYRLNVIPLTLPPLRERPEDILPLCGFFVASFSRKFGKAVNGFNPEAMAILQEYGWPGNVRELRNVVERGCLLTRADTIGPELLLFPKAAARSRPSGA